MSEFLQNVSFSHPTEGYEVIHPVRTVLVGQVAGNGPISEVVGYDFSSSGSGLGHCRGSVTSAPSVLIQNKTDISTFYASFSHIWTSSTIKVHVVAIFFHEAVGGVSVGRHPLVSQFVKGAYRLWPVIMGSSWDRGISPWC